MHKCINYLLLICISFWFFSCGKCPEKQTGKYNFTSEELQINPYNGQEVLLFRSLLEDSVNFSVGDRISDIVKVYPIYVDDGECNGNYTVVETNSTVITSNSNSWQFSIFLRFFPNPSMPGYYKSIKFGAVIPGQNTKTNSDATVIFERDTITGYNYSWPYGDLIYHKSLTLGSKSFTDVYEIELIRNNVTIDNWVNKIYYTIRQGIVGFSNNQNELWFLVN